MSGYGSAVQRRPDELVDILRADFQHRNEPNLAWKSAVSAALNMPGLIGLWTMANIDFGTGNAFDLSGNGATLTNNNSCGFGGSQLAPFVGFNGANQHLSIADAGAGGWGDILGNETYIDNSRRGLTVGGWFLIDTVDATNQFLIGKGNNTVANTAYLITLPAGTTAPQFAVSNGVAFNAMTSATAIGTGVWGCVVARYTAATQTCDLWTNGNQDTDAVGVPAAPLVDNVLNFQIGARPAPDRYLDGAASLCFLCAMSVRDAHAFSFFHQTRAMYGV